MRKEGRTDVENVEIKSGGGHDDRLGGIFKGDVSLPTNGRAAKVTLMTSQPWIDWRCQEQGWGHVRGWVNTQMIVHL